jgi:acyl-CoA synthetase (AMP-forming)/AMP-acid ligase II
MRLHDFLDYWARERPNEEFAVQGSRRLTYREALAQANGLANACIEAGLQIGDRVAVLGKNSLEYALLYYGASKAGVVPAFAPG